MRVELAIKEYDISRIECGSGYHRRNILLNMLKIGIYTLSTALKHNLTRMRSNCDTPQTVILALHKTREDHGLLLFSGLILVESKEHWIDSRKALPNSTAGRVLFGPCCHQSTVSLNRRALSLTHLPPRSLHIYNSSLKCRGLIGLADVCPSLEQVST